MLKSFLIMLTVLFLSTAAYADELTDENKHNLNTYKSGIVTLKENVTAGIITDAQATAGINRYVSMATKISNEYNTVNSVLSFTAPNTKLVERDLTMLQQVAGYVTFMNTLYVIGAFVFVISVVVLFHQIILEMLGMFLHIPMVVYESLGYLAALGLMISGYLFNLSVGSELAFVGVLLFGGAIILSAYLRDLDPKPLNFFSLMLMITIPVTIIYSSEWVGFLAIASLAGLMGFSVLITPGCYAFGFDDDDKIGSVTTASFYILGLAVTSLIIPNNIPYVNLFQDGALYLGSFVGYLGLLILSSKWYDSKQYFIVKQVLTIMAGIGALFIGSVFAIPVLMKIGGTFFILYLIEKIMEIPAKNATGYATIGLVVSSFIGVIYWYSISNPDVISKYLFMI